MKFWETIKDILTSSLISFKEYELTLADLLLIIAGYTLLQFVLKVMRSRLTKAVFKRNKIDIGRQASLLQIIQYVLYTIFFIFSLELIGLNLSILLAGSAALLVGLGFGIQQIFNDLVSGLIMLFEGNVEIGDILEVGDLIGRVEKVGLRTSKITTRENIIIVVPNSKFIVENVINWTHLLDTVRFDVLVGVAYGSDVQLVKELLLQCVKKHSKIVSQPEPIVRFKDFGSSSLDFQICFWSNEVWHIEDVKSDLRFAIDQAFRENNIVIPFPQRDLHFKTTDVPLWENNK